jgi:hypothetical protein
MELEARYALKCRTVSDIYEHLPTLRTYASQCDSIVECGVRDIVSSYAFATAIRGRSNTSLQLIDPYQSAQIPEFLALCDTWHVYGQLKRELAHWHASVAKYIGLHDTTVDAVHGETLRCHLNAHEQSRATGIPLSEITRGIWPAVEEFLAAHPEWILERRDTNNNGLTILRRVSPPPENSA